MVKLDLSFFYDGNQKAWANNRSDVESHINQQVQQINKLNLDRHLNHIEIYKLMGEVGNFLKLIGRFADSEKYFLQVDEIIKFYNVDRKAYTVNKIRWADVKRYAEDFAESEKILLNCLAECREHIDLQNYEDYVLQHLGKLYFDTKNYVKAQDCFQKAIELRKLKNNSELILSTQFALDATLKKMNLKHET